MVNQGLSGELSGKPRSGVGIRNLDSGKPSGEPSSKPSGEPSGGPSGEPSDEPSGEPSGLRAPWYYFCRWRIGFSFE